MNKSGLGPTEDMFLTEILQSPSMPISIEVVDAIAADVAVAVVACPAIFIVIVPISIPGLQAVPIYDDGR
jgi:hypothetical protein